FDRTTLETRFLEETGFLGFLGVSGIGVLDRTASPVKSLRWEESSRTPSSQKLRHDTKGSTV
ncbi:hypothetical protein H6S82_18285, partial [Planktothrix sp. FACHB-1355]|uniref:hypothetical protein n=1 Tax=Planktothrix sp. FACHB-1355 TaxID=2692854 RepID=UPI00168B013B